MIDASAPATDTAEPVEQTSLVSAVGRLVADAPHLNAYTFVDYSVSLSGRHRTMNWAELDQRARAVAVELRSRVPAGARAVVLAPQGLEYVVAMLGAFYARVVAVPLYAPDLPGHIDRLTRIIADCDPACALTTEAATPAVAEFLLRHPAPSLRHVIAVDAAPGGAVSLALRAGEVPPPSPQVPPGALPEGRRPQGRGAADWQDEYVGADDVAYLQYTSGSTRQPAGVKITHGCLAANAAQLMTAMRTEPGRAVTVGWLPLFHDMGFMLTVAIPIMMSGRAVFMDPAAFLKRPARWLQIASEYSGVFTAGPNFAYDYCAARVGDDDKAKLDLSGVRAFLNGAEPVRVATLRSFARAFAGCGLAPETLTPAYGLAEATVYVASGRPEQAATIAAFDREALGRGLAVPSTEDAEHAIVLASCGTPSGQRVAIVDPRTTLIRPPGRVGEIWVNGPNVAPGYFGDSRQDSPFDAVLGSAVEGLPRGGWLRTGDLGLIDGGELFVTGRLKDLIIVDGRNHYPQDVETTTQDAHAAIRKDRVAAFAVSGEDGDRLVVVAERASKTVAGTVDPSEVTRTIRAAVSTHHDLRLHDLVLVRPGAIPLTSSGKIARSACRERYLAGELTPLS